MTICNIVIKENGPDIYIPAQQHNEKYIEFSLGNQSELVSSNVSILLQQNNINPSATASDLMELAIAVYTSDQILSRETNGFQGWSRHFRVHFPVTDTGLWERIKPDLEQMLSFLSGDKWEFILRERSITRTFQSQLISNPNGITKVSLLSGGLDSFIGAIDLLERSEKVTFVSHYKRGSESPKQSSIVSALTHQYGTHNFLHYKFYVQPNQGHSLASKEDTTRARSFLFLVLGLVVANTFGDQIDLIVPENGLISLNVPLTQTRLSSHSTRTTHPYYLSLFEKVVAALGIKNQIVNPYRFKTKGEMMIECKNKKFLLQHYPGTLSCSHPDTSRYIKGTKPGIHCGYCVPCIIRQAAERQAGGINTTYAHQIKNNPPAHSTGKGRDLRAFKMALEEIKNIARHSLILRILKSGPLPFTDQKELNDYTGVYERGMKEVGNFLL
jgi:7-cyano-7-deazaguanine synthase in queuosine biosynthesis